MIRLFFSILLALVYFFLSNLKTKKDLDSIANDFQVVFSKFNFAEGGLFLITDHLIILTIFLIVIFYSYFLGDSKSPKEIIFKFRDINFKLLPIYQVTRILSLLSWSMRELIPFNSLLLVPIIIPISLIKAKIVKNHLEEETGTINILSNSFLKLITLICGVILLFLIPFLQSFIRKTYLGSF